MSTKTKHVRIGIFVLTGVGLFIVGLLAFGAKSYFTPKKTYETAIDGEVGGLSVGSTVLFRGVPIGKVSDIDFAPNLYPSTTTTVIVVEFEVERRIFVRETTAEGQESLRKEQVARGLRAMVKGQGITGTSLLSLERLDPNENPLPAIDYNPRHPYIPSAPGQFTRMLESIERSLRNIEKLNFESIGMGASNTLASAGRLVERLNQTTAAKLDDLLDQLKTAGASIDTAVKNIDSNVKGVKLDAIGKNADDLLRGLKDSNAKLQSVLQNVNTLPLSDTLDNLSSAVQTLNDVLVDLKRYPSGFLFGEPPPATKSVGPAK
jgi:ABC-type transporter Mla subunit MlaD